ncbi:MAG: LysE family translocator [Haloplanus sp.]
MLELPALVAFVPAAVAVVLVPGPDTMYAVSQSLGRGRRAGLVAGVGTATGVLVHTTVAVLGLAALLQTSVVAYSLVKYAGAAYLVYLGVQSFRGDETFAVRPADVADDHSLVDSYRTALVVNVSNPKVAVFVLAFFPQFVSPSANATVQMSMLGVLYAGLSLCYLAGVAWFAGRVRRHLLESATHRRLVRYLGGSVLLGFGLKLAVEGRPTG